MTEQSVVTMPIYNVTTEVIDSIGVIGTPDCICDTQEIIASVLAKTFRTQHCRTDVETFLVLALNDMLFPTGVIRVAQGGASLLPYIIGDVLKAAILMNASFIVLAHNHPCVRKEKGEWVGLEPSEADIIATQKLFMCSSLCNIELYDHLIFGNVYKEEDAFLSMLESGYISGHILPELNKINLKQLLPAITAFSRKKRPKPIYNLLIREA